MSLEEKFLDGCRLGDSDSVRTALTQGCDVNLSHGWGLRRAVRWGHEGVWRILLSHRDIQPNLQNQFGLSALHTAARFNVLGAIQDLLAQPGIRVNDTTILGSSPLMVAVKYCRKEAVLSLIKDSRVELDMRDHLGRRLEEVVGLAVVDPHPEDRHHIIDYLTKETLTRREEGGRRNSMETETHNIELDGLHKIRVFDEVKELLAELRGLQKMDLIKLIGEQEQESARFVTKMDQDIVSYLEGQNHQLKLFFNKLIQDKKEFDLSQQEALTILLKKQEAEEARCEDTAQSETSPWCLASSKHSSRRPSLKTHLEQPTCENIESSNHSLWEWTLPDEGYCTGSASAGELPVMMDSVKQEMECPLCRELLVSPARMWQCKVGHTLCENCRERTIVGAPDTASPCPTCLTVRTQEKIQTSQ